MDLVEVGRQLERTPLKDTSDGSTSWFDMRHEEGLAADRSGRLIEHVVAGIDQDVIRFSREAARAARDGGLVLHGHSIPGASFSAADVALAVCHTGSTGMVIIATTSHPVHGVIRPVRYILDSRSRVSNTGRLTRSFIEDAWDRAFLIVGRILYDEDTEELSPEEGYAQHIHLVMERMSDWLGATYFREVLL